LVLRNKTGLSCALVGLGLCFTACGSSSNPAVSTCVPGQSIMCAGAGGCSGSQVCTPGGTYGVCACAGTDGGAGDASGSDAGSVTRPDVGGIDSPAGIDSPTDAATDLPAGAWSPKSIPGLALWLDDDVGVVADPQNAGWLRHWVDQSGQGNDASPGCTSYGVGCNALLIDPGVIRGHGAIQCNFQQALTIADAPTLQFGSGDYAIAMVVRLQADSTPSAINLWSKPARSGPSLGLTIPPPGTTLMLSDSGQSIGGDISAFVNKFEVVIARGKSLAMSVGASMYTGPQAAGDVSAAGASVTLCQQPGNNSNWVEYAEVIAVKGTLASGDLAQLKAYFAAKFGL